MTGRNKDEGGILDLMEMQLHARYYIIHVHMVVVMHDCSTVLSLSLSLSRRRQMLVRIFIIIITCIF